MPFPRNTLLAVVAASIHFGGNAFVPAAPSVSRTFGARPAAPVFMSSLEAEVDGEPAAEDFIVSAGDLEDEPAAEAEDDVDAGLNRYFHLERISELRTQYRLSDGDTGSPEFQVAGMTERISYLTKHLRAHPKDFSTRRGLVALVNKRRRLLNFLFREDVNRYKNLVQGLGIRHKPPSKVQSKEDAYGRFPIQKNLKGKSKMK